jgi:hypothetical protein
VYPFLSSALVEPFFILTMNMVLRTAFPRSFTALLPDMNSKPHLKTAFSKRARQQTKEEQAAEQALYQKLREECLKRQRAKQKRSKEHKDEEEQCKQVEDEQQRANETAEEEAARAQLVSPSNSFPMEVELLESVHQKNLFSIINGNPGYEVGIDEIENRSPASLQRTNTKTQPTLRQNWHSL